MSTWRVYMTNTVSAVVEVDADDRETAIEKALRKGLPQLRFLDHTYPDEGDWDVEDALKLEDHL